MSTTDNSGTMKFAKPTPDFPKGGTDKKPVEGTNARQWKFQDEGVYETINESLGNGASYSFANIKFNGAADYVAKYRDLIASAPDLLKENQELKALCREVLTAREQYQFFVNGYANGSASISEANHAATVEHEAYSKLWDFIKQSSL